MKFCPKCKDMLILAPLAYPEKSSKKIFTKGNKDKSVCHNCGFIRHSKVDLSSNENLPEKEEVGDGVVKGDNIFATYEHKCKKCGYDKAQVIDCRVFYSDEDTVIFLKCGKCGFSERIGKKVS